MQIQIKVQNKRATANEEEIVTYNNGDELVFEFDEEWNDFPNRVAVAVYEGGAAQVAFTGNSCPFPLVEGTQCDFALVGVYSANGEKRIGSTFVRFRAKEGAHCLPESAVSESLQEQIISLLNGYDWTVFAEKMAEGSYSAVTVNKKGIVTGGGKVFEIGNAGQTMPTPSLYAGGIFFRASNGTYTPFVKTATGLTKLTLATEKLKNPLTVFGKPFDGSAAVAVTKEDLQLSYADLAEKPTLVTSVNGKAGDVSLSKSDFGLEDLTAHRQMPLAKYVVYGADFNNYKSTGFTELFGSADYPMLNAPVSAQNPSGADGDWFMLVLARTELNYITQIAFSVRSDVAVRIRNYSFGEWTEWQNLH